MTVHMRAERHYQHGNRSVQPLARGGLEPVVPGGHFDALGQQALLKQRIGVGNLQAPVAKHDVRVLLLEGVHESAVNLLSEAGYSNVTHLPKTMDGNALVEQLQGVHLLGIRSRTTLTEHILAAASNLIAVGCFSVGTSQVDIQAARYRGVPVFNAPFSNTRSVAELVIGEIIMLLRQILPRTMALQKGQWRKSASRSYEVRGKTLGIIGYGNIGTQLSNLAEAIGMRVIYFDIADKLRHGNSAPVANLTDLLRVADVVSLHVPQTALTKQMIGQAEIAAMKKGGYLINCSRGSVVDLDALAQALRDGHLGGAAVDVFPVEPSSNSDSFTTALQGIDNVILTPHVGGATQEAQERIGVEVARKLIEYNDVGSTIGAVNFPQVQLPQSAGDTRFIQVQHNFPGMLGQLNAVFARRNINITAQHMQTDGEIGYVVMDADCTIEETSDILEEIRKQQGTIRTRVVTPSTRISTSHNV